jgi:predicted cobalt transporter CbtA
LRKNLSAAPAAHQEDRKSWALATTFVVVMGIAFLWRFQQGKWQKMRVIECSVID